MNIVMIFGLISRKGLQTLFSFSIKALSTTAHNPNKFSFHLRPTGLHSLNCPAEPVLNMAVFAV